ncbi:hypothetical protein BJV78DRAFT_1228905 [Lactifluus subvellereus]|nr:hypothetical protein BJV78DRAFT_1228905 [Lactifluus subvellereus]
MYRRGRGCGVNAPASRRSTSHVVGFPLPISCLSIYHTAELTDESIPDEVLHLTAAMPHSRVGTTMWAMGDTDIREMSEHWGATRCCAGAAETQKDDRERWIKLVHHDSDA